MANITDLLSTAEPDPDLKARELRILEQLSIDTPTYCFECGKCTSGCPAMRLLELEPHDIMAKVNLGFVQELVNSEAIWNCVTCYKCAERCPQGVSPVETILALRNLAVASGIEVPQGFTVILLSIMERGLFQEPTEIMIKDPTTGKKGFASRQELGLPEASMPKDRERYKLMFMSTLGELL